MPAKGRPWNRERQKYRDKCEARNAPCWICRGVKGPIDYKAEPRTPLSFSVDHAEPTSRPGVDPMRIDQWRPAHYGCNSSRGNETRRAQLPTSRKW